jgi:DNA-binding MarR family transcriptional regulator
MVVESPGIKQIDVARLLGIKRSGLVAIVDGLEARGLVGRRSHPTDRRIQELQPTEKGEAVYRRALEAVAAHEARFLTMLSPREQDTLLQLLRKIRHHVEDAV